jgi:hypothetical protein
MIYDELIATLKRQHALLVELIGLTSLRINRDGDASGIDRVNLDLYQKQALEVEAKIKRAEQMDLTYGKLLQRQAEIGSSIIALDFRILHACIDGDDTSSLMERKYVLYNEYELIYREITDKFGHNVQNGV